MSFEGRTVVITGASGALGSQVAKDAGAGGAQLALLERSAEKLAALVESLALPPERVLTQTVDLLDPAATRAAADAVAVRFGQVHVLVHVVGGWVGGKTLLHTGDGDLRSMLNQHIWTSFNALQAFAPHMVLGGWGRIIMITSPAATRPSAKGSAYAAGKAAQEALMLTLSQELKGTGVTANLLQVRTIDGQREKVSSPSNDNASWSTPEELSAAIQYLVSDAAGNVNGAKLPMFGSYS